MKIGIDCRLYSSRFTGIGRYTHELVDHLIKINDTLKRTHEIVLFFNQPEYSAFTPPNPAIKKVLVNAPHYSLKEQTHFLKDLNKEKCDVVHFPHFNVPIFYRKPYIVTIHDLTLSLFPGRKMTKWYHRLGYHLTIKNAVKKAKKVIAVSNNTKQDIVSHLKIPEEKISVIHNGINPQFRLVEDIKQVEKTLKKYDIKKNFLLYTGVWRNHKNLTGLIEAFNILKTEKKLDLNLVITGNPDPNYPEVLKTIKELKLGKDVLMPGLVSEEELVHLYNGATIYTFPSFYEGFGLPPLEAMRCGTPVAASNNSSIPEVCGEDNAVFFNPKDPQDIAEKIEMLYKDVELQASLMFKGMQHSQKFSWETMAKKTYEIIKHANV